jgi:hypothetical protein
LTALADRLFRESDRRARELGWEISRSRTGLGRRYRDPRLAVHLAHRAEVSSTGLRRSEGADR